MDIKLGLLCIFQVSLIHVGLNSQAKEFVNPPMSVNATLNSNVSFQCQTNVDATLHSWSINGSLLPTASRRAHGNISEVEVFCSEDQNLSEVTCGLLLVDESGFSMVFNTSVLEVRCGVLVLNNGTPDTIFGDPALLQIQGLLGPVTNLAVLSTTNTSITLTWDPPFSLDITGVEPDFTHTVEVYNITDGERELVNTTRDITDPSYTFFLPEQDEGLLNASHNVTFSPVNPDPLYEFQFVVFAVNAVGEGERSDPVNASFSEDAPTTDSPTTIPTTTTTDVSQDGGGSMSGSNTGSSPTPSTSDPVSPSKKSNPVLVPAIASVLSLVILAIFVVIAVVLIYLCVRRQNLGRSKVHNHHPPQTSFYENVPPRPYANVSPGNEDLAAEVSYQTSAQLQTAGKDGPTYVTVDNLALKNDTLQPLLSNSSVVYSEVPKHLNAKNLVYEHVNVKPPSKVRPPDDPFTVVYSEIKPKEDSVMQPTDKNHPQVPVVEVPSTPSAPEPLTLDNLTTALYPLAHKWKDHGFQLGHGLDEDRIDELYTNNETDEACLEDMLDYYMKNVNFAHTWEEICGALREIGEEGMANKILSSYGSSEPSSSTDANLDLMSN